MCARQVGEEKEKLRPLRVRMKKEKKRRKREPQTTRARMKKGGNRATKQKPAQSREVPRWDVLHSGASQILARGRRALRDVFRSSPFAVVLVASAPRQYPLHPLPHPPPSRSPPLSSSVSSGLRKWRPSAPGSALCFTTAAPSRGSREAELRSERRVSNSDLRTRREVCALWSSRSVSRISVSWDLMSCTRCSWRASSRFSVSRNRRLSCASLRPAPVSKETYCRGKRDLVRSKRGLYLLGIPELRVTNFAFEFALGGERQVQRRALREIKKSQK